MKTEVFELADKNATKALGSKIAQHMMNHPGLILLSGNLGAGKTTFAQGFIENLHKNPLNITSPTYTYVNIYEALIPVYHFDLYRIENPSEIRDLGLLEQLYDDNAIRLVEWPERFPALAQKAFAHIYLEIEPKGRKARVNYFHPCDSIT